MAKITNKLLDRLDKQLEKRKKIHVETSLGTYEVLINEIFSELKIKKIVSDVLTIMKPLLESNEIKVEDLVAPTALLPILTLREFTDLPIPQENDLATLSAVSERLDDHGFFRQVLPQFNQYEIKKLNDIIGNAFKNVTQVQNMIQELYAKFAIQEMSKEEVESDATVQESN